MARNDELRAEIQALRDSLKPGAVYPGGIDSRLVNGVAVVTSSIIKLEETSFFLTVVNIILSILLLLFGGLQIAIMLKKG
jgi:hypothetical protein